MLADDQPDGAPFPVEFKYGRKRRAVHDDIQLAAQALCLEGWCPNRQDGR
ncbi:MAG: hypothetical protein WAT23_11385 [Chromatiaceae bacterium]